MRETRLVRGLEVSERQGLLLLLGIAVALRILLIATSPTPYGYV